MRILVAIAEMRVGGAEAVAIELVRASCAAGDSVALVAASGPLDAALDDIPLDRWHLPADGRSPRRVAASTAAGRRALRATCPQLLHAHNPRITGTMAVAMWLSPPWRRVPLLATYHGVAPGETRWAARILRLADHVACVSRGLTRQLASTGMPSDKLSTIHNGVPPIPPLAPERRAQLDAELELEGSQVVTAVGRLVPQKAHHRFLAAASRIAEQVPNVRFLVVGEGPLRAGLERRARELGLGGKVRFTGLRRDARELIVRSDLLVFSSDWEGLSLAALEGLAAGVPVVATDVAGMSEALSTGAGVIVSPDVEALAASVVALLREPERRAAIGREGRRLHGERFSTRRMVDDYRALYASLLRKRQTSTVEAAKDLVDRGSGVGSRGGRR